MELYRKKINLSAKAKQNPKSRYFDNHINTKSQYDLYLQKSIEKQNLEPQNNPINLSCVNESIPNFRISMQDLFSNDESRRKAIRYVINARRRSPSPSEDMSPFQRSVSPMKNTRRNIIRNLPNLEISPNKIQNYRTKEFSQEPYTTKNYNISRNVIKKNIYNGNPKYVIKTSNYTPLNYSNANLNSGTKINEHTRYNTSVSHDKNLREIKDIELTEENEINEMEPKNQINTESEFETPEDNGRNKFYNPKSQR